MEEVSIGLGIGSVSLESSGKRLRVKWSDGKESVLLSQWLRFSCSCAECFGPSTHQRTKCASELLGHGWPKICSAKENNSNGKLLIDWEYSGTKHHHGVIEQKWLRDNWYDTTMSRAELSLRSKPPSTKSVPVIGYSEVIESENGLWRWMHYLYEYGICVVKDTPTDLGVVETIAEKIGCVKESLLGKVWDVKFVDKGDDVMNSSDRLELHQDEPYYEESPGIVFLHCIRNDSHVVGGENVCIDAFPVIEEFKKAHPQHFKTLSTVPATFQKLWKKGEEVIIKLKRQKHHIAVDRYGEVIGISWSQHNVGPVYAPEDEIEAYFEAYLELSKAFDNSPTKLHSRPEKGDVLTLNNKRMLHSRDAFTLNGGSRHLQGTYVSIDSFKSKYMILSEKLSKSVPQRRLFDGSLL